MDNDYPIDSYVPTQPMVPGNIVNMQSIRAAQVTIESLIIMDTGTFNTPVIRPYVTNVRNDNMEPLINSINRVSQNGNVLPATIAGTTSDFLTVSTQGETPLAIPNSWNTNRLRFILIVKIEGRLSSTRRAYFQGYTEYSDSSMTGLLDPKMKFIINSFTVIEQSDIMTPVGNQVFSRVVESSNILMPNFSEFNNIPISYIRPNDVFQGIQTNHIPEIQNSTIFDTRSESTIHSKSFKSNNNNLSYLSKIFDNYLVNSRMTDRPGLSDNYTSILDSALDKFEGAPLTENPFLRMLSGAYGASLRAVTDFSLEILNQIDPMLQHKVKYIAPQGQLKSTLPTVNSGEYWHTQTRETLAATIILNSISAMMFELMISKVKLVSTNFAVNGQMTTNFYSAMSLTGMDVSPYLQQLKDRIERELMYDLTFMNQDSYQLMVEIDLFGSSSIQIGFGGQPMVPYIQPTFADSLFSPVITSNQNIKNNLVNDFEYMLNAVTSDRPIGSSNPGF